MWHSYPPMGVTFLSSHGCGIPTLPWVWHSCPPMDVTFLPSHGCDIPALPWMWHSCPPMDVTFLPSHGCDIPALPWMWHSCPPMDVTFLPSHGCDIPALPWMWHSCPPMDVAFLPCHGCDIPALPWMWHSCPPMDVAFLPCHGCYHAMLVWMWGIGEGRFDNNTCLNTCHFGGIQECAPFKHLCSCKFSVAKANGTAAKFRWICHVMFDCAIIIWQVMWSLTMTSSYDKSCEVWLWHHLTTSHMMTKLRSIFNSKVNDSIKIGLCRSAVESILLYGLECIPLTLTLQDKLDSAYRRILRYSLGVHFPVCISNAELARRTGATALSKTLRQRRLTLVGHALRMANPSPLTILLRFLQPGLRRRRGQARTLTLHQNIIDDISAINQSVKSITSASSSYFSRIVATLSTNWAFNIYIYVMFDYDIILWQVMWSLTMTSSYDKSCEVWLWNHLMASHVMFDYGIILWQVNWSLIVKSSYDKPSEVWLRNHLVTDKLKFDCEIIL